MSEFFRKKKKIVSDGYGFHFVRLKQGRNWVIGEEKKTFTYECISQVPVKRYSILICDRFNK